MGDAEIQTRATDELTDRLLDRAGRDVTLALARGLAANAKRAVDESAVREAIALLTPLLPAALDEALVGAPAPDDALTLRETAMMFGLPRHGLERLVRSGRAPVPHKKTGRAIRFRRGDVERFLGLPERAAAESGHALLVEAIRGAIENTPTKAPRALIRTTEAAARLGITVSGLHYRLVTGKNTLQPVRLGAKLYFRTADVEAHLAARAAKTTQEK